ncbi:MAG TPA: hypothetical protein ENJ39_07635 [Flammeovirgaceae bacterium]|nr:hypothetical protein [Flammeovirgaceae bacterium]
MNEHPLDKLFAEKLIRQQMAPSADAWQQIAGQLNKKGRTIRHYRWLAAAAIALLALLGGVMYLYRGDYQPQPESRYTQADIPPQPTMPALDRQAKPVYYLPEINARQEVVVRVVAAKTPKQTGEQHIIAVTAPLPQQPDRGERLSPEPTPATDSEAAPLLALHEETKNSVTASNLPPVTAIYKPGPVEQPSKIVKAIQYVDGVRRGEKRLPTLKDIKRKIKDNLRDNNSK